MNLLKPVLLSLFKEGYPTSTFIKDLFAGIIVGILTIPLSLSFAIASGARPEQGLYTAIIAGLLVALFGGSRVQVSGPTGAFVILIYSIIQSFGYDGLAIATLLAGIFLVLMGLSRFGSFIKFIPYPVTIGFTSGLALILVIGQIPDILGLKIPKFPTEFIPRCKSFIDYFSTINIYAFLLSFLSIALVSIWPRISKKIPGTIIAILLTTLLVQIFHLPVETIHDRFGDIPNKLPSPHFPTNFSLDFLFKLIPSAIAIAFLAAIESLLSAVVADGMTGKRHRSDMELIAQGIGNIGCVFFQGICATGAIARTATNIKNGGQTPIAAIVHSIVIFLILLAFGRWVSFIPMATLASVLAIVAYNMSEWRHFAKIFSSPRADIAILLTTFFLTVFTDLTTAIEVGIILACFLFINTQLKNSKFYFLKESLNEEDNKDDPLFLKLKNLPKDIEVFDVFGPLFFAAIENFKNTLTNTKKTPKVLILRLIQASTIDATGIRALEDVLAKSHKEKTSLFICGASCSLNEILKKSGFIEKLGKEHLFPDFDSALQAAYKICPPHLPLQQILEKNPLVQPAMVQEPSTESSTKLS